MTLPSACTEMCPLVEEGWKRGGIGVKSGLARGGT
jgi:hypothetical protein